VKKLTKEQGLILSGFTGVLCINSFSALHADVEKRLGRPVYTHEFPSIENEIREAYRIDFMKIIQN